MRILGYICTKGRYDTTLPMAMLSMIQQTRRVDKFMVFDDNSDADKRNPRNMEHYHYLIKLLEDKGIPWEWVWAKKMGAHHSHEMANMKGFDLAWFIDDDCVAEPNCLEKLELEMKDNVGAVGGLILQPPAKPLPPNIDDNKIDSLHMPNIQWFRWEGKPRNVEHIYSQFLYRCNVVHHDLRLSSVVFRGETMFTHSLFLGGYRLIVTPNAITWHFQSTGGIHSGQTADNWSHDEQLFRQWLAFRRMGRKLYVLDNGLGDHYMFLQAIKPEPDSIIACCYPEALRGYNLMSIAEAEKVVDKKDYDVYEWCVQNHWKGTLVAAFREMYANINCTRQQ